MKRTIVSIISVLVFAGLLMLSNVQAGENCTNASLQDTYGSSGTATDINNAFFSTLSLTPGAAGSSSSLLQTASAIIPICGCVAQGEAGFFGVCSNECGLADCDAGASCSCDNGSEGTCMTQGEGKTLPKP